MARNKTLGLEARPVSSRPGRRGRSTSEDHWLGATLAGSYRIERCIGRGGMGSVYEASHTRLPRRFAIKVLNPLMHPDAAWQARFRREAEVSSRLRHRHIVEVVDYNHAEGGQPYIVMEYLEGRDLADRIDEGPLSAGEALTLIRQLGSALSTAHKQGVVHRDLKPQNVMLCPAADEPFEAKILDFGIAKFAEDSSLTREGDLMGTPQYISPEQVLGRALTVDARADQFSLGVICYEALTGQLPFDRASIAATLHAVAYEDPPPLHQLNPTLSPALAAVIAKAMAKAPDTRYGSMAEFVGAYEDAVGAESFELADITGPVVPRPSPGRMARGARGPGAALSGALQVETGPVVTPSAAPAAGSLASERGATGPAPRPLLVESRGEASASVATPGRWRSALGALIVLTLGSGGVYWALASRVKPPLAVTRPGTEPPTPSAKAAPAVPPASAGAASAAATSMEITHPASAPVGRTNAAEQGPASAAPDPSSRPARAASGALATPTPPAAAVIRQRRVARRKRSSRLGRNARGQTRSTKGAKPSMPVAARLRSKGEKASSSEAGAGSATGPQTAKGSAAKPPTAKPPTAKPPTAKKPTPSLAQPKAGPKNDDWIIQPKF